MSLIMRLVNMLRALMAEDEIFGAMDRPEALRYVGRAIREGHLTIPKSCRQWDDSVWDYMHRGIWFHPTHEDLIKAHRKAKQHGFPCDPNVAEFRDGYRVSFPRMVEDRDYMNRKAPRLP